MGVFLVQNRRTKEVFVVCNSHYQAEVAIRRLTNMSWKEQIVWDIVPCSSAGIRC